MDQIFNTNLFEFSQSGFDNLIVGNGDSGFVNFEETSLVNQISNSFEGRITEGDIRFNSSQHILSSCVNSEESGVVNLSQSQ